MKKIKLKKLEISSFNVNPKGEVNETVKGGYDSFNQGTCDSSDPCQSYGNCSFECNSLRPCTDGYECDTAYNDCDGTGAGPHCSSHPCIV